MSDGLKTGLIVVGAGLAAYLLYQKTQVASAVAAGVPSIPGASSNLATSPGAAPAPSSTPATPPGTSHPSTLSTVAHYTALAAIAPIVLPTKLAIVGAKAVGGAVESAFKSIF